MKSTRAPQRNDRVASLGRTYVLVMVVISAAILAAILLVSILGLLSGLSPRLVSAVDATLSAALVGVLVAGTLFYFRTVNTRLVRLERREAETRSLLENVSEGVMTTAPDGVILEVNDAFLEMTGFDREEVIGEKPSILRSDHHDDAFYAAMWTSLEETGRWRGEIWNRRKNGEALPYLLGITSVLGDDGKLAKYIALYDDITELKESEEQIKYAAYHDALTGLPNRVLLTDRLSVALVNAERKKESLALVFLDLDRFKNINDSLGHAMGDQALVRVAELLESSKRQGDTVARWGGDEFVILLPGISKPEEAASVSRRILSAFSRPISVEEHDVFVSPSIGIALYPDDGEETEVLLKSADMALYRAKEEGRNTFKFYTLDFERDASERMMLENDLRQALDEEQFVVHYQPQVRISTGRIVGVEALLRWRHPTRGMIPPGRFIPVAEDTGMIVPLGEWMMATACREHKEMVDAGLSPRARLSLNVSVVQFAQPDFVDRTRALLERGRVNPRTLDLEITESLFLEDTSTTVAKIHTLQDWGLTLSLDDFGTGYSSLSYLHTFQVDTLKIDRQFIRNIPENADNSAITSAILAMAANLDVNVVAEGVEKERQVEFLRDRGCDVLQGFIYSRPVPASEVVRVSGRKLPWKL